MTQPVSQPIAIVGAGLCGNLLAILLARSGFRVTVYEQSPDPAQASASDGRSINLALAARGIRALVQAGVFDDIRPLLLPMTGRIVHDSNGTEQFHAYGQHADEQIWSVSRSQLNLQLQNIARERWGIRYRYGSTCTAYDTASGIATFATPDGTLATGSATLIAADGAGSVIRRSLAQAGVCRATEDLLDHGYKELLIPATEQRDFALDPHGLHIWPRGGFMLIALPNTDRTFTATLFLPHRGSSGFAAVAAESVTAFFATHFADVLPLLPNLREEFASRPVGVLGTIHCQPWHHVTTGLPARRVLLIGDAAHAIVPFHGQGMNAAFEDCAELDRLLVEHNGDWERVLPRFDAARRPNAEAIARMALENYAEMRDTVRDPGFSARAALSFALERQFPGRFIPRYSMVMFHPEIPYADAETRGRLQAALLDDALQAGAGDAALTRAIKLVTERL